MRRGGEEYNTRARTDHVVYSVSVLHSRSSTDGRTDGRTGGRATTYVTADQLPVCIWPCRRSRRRRRPDVGTPDARARPVLPPRPR